MTHVALHSILAVLPVLAFAVLYRRYSVFPSAFALHAGNFLLGMMGAAILLALLPFISFSRDPWTTAFFLAALPERSMVLALIALSSARIRDRGSISEMMMAGIVIGLGFATMESLAYGIRQGYQVALLRLMVPVPLHAALSAASAGGLALAILYRHPFYRLFHGVMALVGPVALHTLVDGLLFVGADIRVAAVLVLILLRLEYRMARARIVPPVDVLEALGVTYEEWRLMQEQAGLERLSAPKTARPPVTEPFFRLRWSAPTALVLAALMLPPAGYLLFASPEAFSSFTLSEQRLAFVWFPLFLVTNILVVGSVNPEHFRRGSVPTSLRIRARIPGGMATVRGVHLFGCFFPTSADGPPRPDFAVGARIPVRFEHGGLVSPELAGRASWQNSGAVQEHPGMIVLFESVSLSGILFFSRLYLRQILAALLHRCAPFRADGPRAQARSPDDRS